VSAVELHSLRRCFGDKVALAGLDLRVDAGQICALLGPNGAGKTTLIRTLTGLIAPTDGSALVDGIDVAAHPLSARRRIGFFPSGDRTFYLRISGRENLAFFGRLYGLSRRDALARADQRLADVELTEAANQRVGTYSHGMQKRLAMARALLLEPAVLLIDEATHDLDPISARRVKQLVRGIAHNGAAVLWATQRLEEIRGFADHVVVLDHGRERFSGPVEQLMLRSAARSYLLRLRSSRTGTVQLDDVREALGEGAWVERMGDSAEHVRMALAADAVLGDAFARLAAAGLVVLDCTQERSEIEEAFLHLTDVRSA
jgi:ABC-2 type transport system ATP-binding protein